MKTLVDEYIEYLSTTPPDQVAKDWEYAKAKCNFGPTIGEILEHDLSVGCTCFYGSCYPNDKVFTVQEVLEVVNKSHKDLIHIYKHKSFLFNFAVLFKYHLSSFLNKKHDKSTK